jgi:DNA modification methylase
VNQIEMVSIGQLLPYARNARTHDDAQVAQIAASIKEFGFNNPILIADDQSIVAGHGRLAAARKLGLTEVPVVRLSHLSDTQRKAYILADNRLALNAGWDNDLLKLELQELEIEGVDLEMLGFSKEELDGLLNSLEPTEGLTDEDAVPEPPEEPITKPGDIWILGKHRLMCGDSTSVDHLATLTAGALVDMWLTDPPYNVDMTSKNKMLEKAGKARKDKSSFGIENDSMSDDKFRQFLRDSYTAADSVMKPGAVFYIWHSDSEGYNFRGAAQDSGWEIRQCLIWQKSVFAIGRSDYHWQHEPCLYGWKEGAGHLWASDRKQTTLLKFDKPSKSGEHPTMKPVALFEYQMLNNTKGGDIVLDSFGGSGTTLIAAEKNGRIAYLMELDPKYCDVIVKRWEEFTGKKAELADLRS